MQLNRPDVDGRNFERQTKIADAAAAAAAATGGGVDNEEGGGTHVVMIQPGSFADNCIID